MSLVELKRLPVWNLAADNAVLAMWYTGTHTEEAIELAEAWGFRIRTMKGFTWVKLNQHAERRFNKALTEGELVDFNDLLSMLNSETRMNGGNHTRANTEDLLIATCGAGLERASASIKQVVYSCLGEHSEKPWRFAVGLNCFTAMSVGWSFSRANHGLAGTAGEISARVLLKCIRENLSPGRGYESSHHREHPLPLDEASPLPSSRHCIS